MGLNIGKARIPHRLNNVRVPSDQLNVSLNTVTMMRDAPDYL